MLRQSQSESESAPTNNAAPSVQTDLRPLELNTPFVTKSLTTPQEIDDDLTLSALRLALVQRKQSLPETYLKAGGFTALGAFSVWMVTYQFFMGTLLLIMLSATGASPLITFAQRNKAVQEALNALANTDDLRAVGPLAEALSLWDPSPTVSTTLCRLLPRLRPSDADLLNEQQRACLRRAIKQNTSRFLSWRTDPIFADILNHALETLELRSAIGQTSTEEFSESQTPHIERLLQLFQDAVRQRRKNTVNMGMAATFSATFAVANLFTLNTPPPNNYLFYGAIGALGLTLSLSFRGLLRLKGLMKELANVSDLRIAGPLLEILALEDGTAKSMAALLLSGLLPRFRASDAKILTDAQHNALLRTLTRNDGSPDFFVAALKALEQIGDARALPVVESLAIGRGATIDPHRVQAAAQDCLPFLQIRCDQQRASQTLLRASSATATATDTLLRPAQNAGTTNPSQLLRPNPHDNP